MQFYFRLETIPGGCLNQAVQIEREANGWLSGSKTREQIVVSTAATYLKSDPGNEYLERQT